MKKVLFWDFDGTIIYPNESFLDALDRTVRRFGFEIERGDMRRFLHRACSWYSPEVSYENEIGGGWWRRLFGRFEIFFEGYGIPRVFYPEMEEFFRGLILDFRNYRLYEDAEGVLRECLEKGYLNYILSNNFPELSRVVECLGLGNYFAGYVVSSAVGYEKPRAEIFQRALQAAGDPEICYMIGDNPMADIRGGHEVGMKTVLVHTAGGSGADWNCGRLTEIPAILV